MMDFRRLAKLFEGALARSGTDRAGWLTRACPDDPELRREVEAMLRAHDSAGGILDRGAGAFAALAMDGIIEPEDPPSRVGPYVIEGEIGRGGMGVVYRAHDPRLGRRVALKFLARELGADERVRARFLAEARAASSLDHPNICTIYDVGESESGRLYIAMAFYEGETLAERLERGPLPLEEALRIAVEVAAGLERAHEAGIVHRDIKPSNIVVTGRGTAKILDFGIARLEGGTTLTQPGVIVGTPAYMSPEQLRGEEIDGRADLWSLGVVLYEMLAGERPYTGIRQVILERILHEDPRPLTERRPDLPPAVGHVVDRLLARSVERRYPDAGAARRDLEALRSGSDPGGFTPEPRLRHVGLPTELTPFVGRERELSELSDLLDRARLVTLTGPGGTGKTRLALELAASSASRFPDGAAFVALSGVLDPALVPSAIASALGISESAARPTIQTVIEVLHDRSVLLVLDNFEQVADAATHVSELLRGCPGVKAVVTSRMALHVSGEHEYPVPSLELPDPSDADDPDAVAGSPAVALFIERARASRPDFRLTPANARSVANLCIHLDGLPLAIELAAARIKLFSPDQMLSRLERRFELLRGGPRDRPPRQQTLRDSIEWSYGLLSPPEQRAFRTLAVFIGGFHLEGAERVFAGSGATELQALETVGSLIDHSLLRKQERAIGESRFVMLETIRAYALEKLEAEGERNAAARAHARYMLALAERAAPELTGPTQAEWLDRLGDEHDNIRAALDWIEAEAEWAMALRMGGALWRFWLARGHLNEGWVRLDRTVGATSGWGAADEIGASGEIEATGEVGAADGDSILGARARALNGLGTLAHNRGENRRAADLLREALELWRGMGDRTGMATALNNLAWVSCELGDFDDAVRTSEEALALCREQGDRRGVAVALNNLGWVANYRGHYGEARAYHEENLAIRRELGDRRHIGFALASLAWAESNHGEFDACERLTEEALAVLREVDDRFLMAFALHVQSWSAYDRGDLDRAQRRLERGVRKWTQGGGGNRSGLAMTHCSSGLLACERGEWDQARERLERGREIFESMGSRWGIAGALHGLGRVEEGLGEPDRALELYRESVRMRLEMGETRGIAESLESAARVIGDDAAAVRMLAAAHAARERIGAPVPPVRRSAYDARLRELHERLGEPAFEVEWARGRGLELAEASGLMG